MRVLVTGSRTWEDHSAVWQALQHVYNLCRVMDEGLTVVHGACPKGPDSMAEKWAANMIRTGGNNLTVERHPAKWGQHGRAAGPLRNQMMVKSGVAMVLAFWDGVSEGTAGTVKMALDEELLVLLKMPDSASSM
jgi:hypothetical protein